MSNETALEAAVGASAAAGAKSATTAVTSGLSTVIASVLAGVNWATLIGVGVTLLTAWMTWYFKNEERSRAQRQEDADKAARARREERELAAEARRQRESDIRISLMLAGQDAGKLPKTESELGDLPCREVANG